ncbi:hypothetical protein [Ahrensia sp. R2A130]|uniref:hypothetical protein n=1 Tax=Ahrensia sp. R2A130 TaxID=744979 RepID=UPI0001E0B511|nr:hypothetical protein [Ahrensia sp. R2A130]EFL88287.1 hypothetical protein R2A130_3454 [Ahrensia sp. R2A130]
MAETITVPLSRLYEEGGTTFDEIEIKAPWRALYAQHGDPFAHMRLEDGTIFFQVLHAVVDDYLRELIVEPGFAKIGAISVPDAKLVEKALFDFFSKGDGVTPTTPLELSAEDMAGADPRRSN